MKTALIALVTVLALLSVYFVAFNNQELNSNADKPTIKQYETCRNAKCNGYCNDKKYEGKIDETKCNFSAYYYGNCVPTNASCLAYEEERMDITKADDPLPQSWYDCQTECGVENPNVSVENYPIFDCYLECGDYAEYA